MVCYLSAAGWAVNYSIKSPMDLSPGQENFTSFGLCAESRAWMGELTVCSGHCR